MPKIYATTKKGKLESMLRKSGQAFTKQEMIQAMKQLGINISRSSVDSAVEEWLMNYWLRKEADGRYSWTLFHE